MTEPRQWFVDLRSPSDSRAQGTIYFASFDALLAFVANFAARKTGYRLRAHLSADATPAQRQQLSDLGTETI